MIAMGYPEVARGARSRGRAYRKPSDPRDGKEVAGPK
jgi:hypothetical protein